MLNTTLGFRGIFATFMSSTWYFARARARVLGIFYAWPWAVGLAFSAGTTAAVTGGFSRCSLAVRRFLSASRLPHGFADHTDEKPILAVPAARFLLQQSPTCSVAIHPIKSQHDVAMRCDRDRWILYVRKP